MYIYIYIYIHTHTYIDKVGLEDLITFHEAEFDTIGVCSGLGVPPKESRPLRKELVSCRSVSVCFVSSTWPFRFVSFPLPGCFGSTRFLNITSRFGPFRPRRAAEGIPHATPPLRQGGSVHVPLSLSFSLSLYIYIYVYTERERERDIHIYVYIYIYT